MSTLQPKPRVAFLGLGLMGSGMARRLLEANFPLTVYNRNPAKTAPLIAAGAKTGSSPRKVATGAEVIISMVADDEAARSVWLDEHGALASVTPGTICIECSTASVGWAHELSTAVITRGGEFLDAPGTGNSIPSSLSRASIRPLIAAPFSTSCVSSPSRRLAEVLLGDQTVPLP